MVPFSNLQAIRGIEKLDGAAGYDKHIVSPPKRPDSKFPRANDWPQTTAVAGNAWSALVYTGITVGAAGLTDNGHAWGLGVGEIYFTGIMGFHNLELLKSAPNDIHIIGDNGIGDGILIYLSIEGKPVALIATAAEGLADLIGIDGSLTWK